VGQNSTDVDISRDGKRIYFSNSLYGTWDAQFHAEGIRGWGAKWMRWPTAALSSTRTFSFRSKTSGPIRFGFRAVTLRRTPSVFRDTVDTANLCTLEKYE